MKMDTKPALKIAEVDPANLGDPSDRARVAPAAIKAMIRIAETWKLNVGEACALLGGISERTWYRMKKGEAGEASGQDVLTRISAIVGIYKGLRILFSEPLSTEWVSRPNRDPIFGGRTPLAAMIGEGIPKMLQTRAYIDALRGGL
jgi:Protein of unknown function (DUF2384)